MRRLLCRRQMAIVAAVVVVVVAGAAVAASAMTGGGKPVAARTTTFAVRSGTLTVTASVSGTVQPIDSRALTFGTSGTVSTLEVKAGDRVTEGETLATLDPAAAQSAVSSAQSALDAANTNLSLAQEQVTAAPGPTGCVAGAAFGLATPSATAPPPASPSPRPPASPSPQPIKSRGPSAAASPTNSGDCGSGSGRSGSGGSGSAGGSHQGTGTDSLLRAQQAVNNARLTLEQAEAKLAGTTIVAPSAGHVLSVAGAVGRTASAGGSGFIVLAGVDSLAVEAQFSEADVAAVAVGQSATVTLANHPGVTYQGEVTEVDPAGTASGQLVRYGVQIEFTKPPSDLLLGQSAVAAVVTASAPNVIYVPNAALSNLTGDTATVTVRAVGGDVTRTVTIGLAGDQGTEITSGLVAGDVVVVPTG